MELSSQDSHRFLRIHSNEMKAFMFAKENTLKSAFDGLRRKPLGG